MGVLLGVEVTTDDDRMSMAARVDRANQRGELAPPARSEASRQMHGEDAEAPLRTLQHRLQGESALEKAVGR